MHTPPPPGSRATAEARNCVCAKRWIWGRGSQSLFTEQRRLSSDAKATKSWKANLPKHTYVSRERRAGPKARTGSPDAGAEKATTASALGPPAAAAAPRPPAPVLERSRGWGHRGCISMQNICISLATVPINTKPQPRKARSGEGAFVPGFKTPLGETEPFFAAQGGLCEEHYGGQGR